MTIQILILTVFLALMLITVVVFQQNKLNGILKQNLAKQASMDERENLIKKEALITAKEAMQDSGISEENLQNMKQPFFSTKKAGTGLGVYLSKEIIKAHEGNLTYYSKEGKGTKVKIILPIKKDIQFS